MSNGQVETFEYHLTVRDDAKGPMAATSKEAMTLGGAVERLQTGAKNLQQRMAPTAAAISGVTAALGAQAGQMGQVVNATGQVAAAFGAGGPLAAALALTVAGVSALSKAWEDEIAAADRALAKQYEAVDAAIGRRKTAVESLEAFKRSQLTAYGREKADIDDMRRRADALRASTDAMAAAAEKANARAKGGTIAGRALESQVTQARAELRALDEEIELRTKALAAKDAEARSAAFVAGMAPSGGARASGGGRVSGGAAEVADEAAFDDTSFGGVTLEGARELADRRFALAEAARERENQAAADAANALIALERDKAAQILANDKALAEQAAADAKARNLEQQALAEQAIGFAASASQQLITGLIAGQEDAVAKFGVAVMQQAGQSLIASGTKLFGEAVFSSLTPGGQGLAATQFAGAAGLIAGGVALGGVAGGIGAGLGGGARNPRARAEVETPRAPGLTTGGRGGSGGGAHTSVTIVYAGVSGPTADQGGRAAVRAISRARARGERARGER